MAGDTVITIIGNLTADPELRFTSAGVPVANFTVASTPRFLDGQSNEWKGRTARRCSCGARCGGRPLRTSRRPSRRAPG
ncbi:MAG: single-strand DNA-binding protein [Actinomycetota bacterium]|nr:single-strand DNA-binding protein [Actinomycetota bacterium]